MNVVLREPHDGLVVGGEGRGEGIIPVQRGGVGSFEVAHVQEEDLIVRDRIEDVRVVVEDGVEVENVEGTGVHRLGGPRLGAGVIDVHVRRVGLVRIYEVDGVEELGEIAGGAVAIEWTAGPGE